MRAPSADREIELKLLVDRSHLPVLADRLKDCPKAFSGPESRWLESRYFDTPDRRLAARGVSLRVRRIGDDHIQTLKARSGDQGVHIERGEWECPVDGPEPMLERITDPEALDRLGLVLPEELELVFTTEIERRVMLVEQPVAGAPPAIIEVAFDDGAVVLPPTGLDAGADAGGGPAPDGARRRPIAEIELELKAGPARGLYLLLQELRQWAPLAITVVDKSARGYRLAGEAGPQAVRASRPSIEAETGTGEALALILDNCTGQWLRNLAPAEDGSDIEGVHQLRVAVRRARSALTMFTDAIGRDQRLAWSGRLKTVLVATGSARTLDVFLDETLPAIAAQAPPEDAPALAALAARAEAARAQAYETLRRYLAGRAHADLVLDWAGWVALEGWHETAPTDGRQVLAAPVIELARRLLEKRHKRVKKLGRQFASLADEERHEVRLALKKLRYGVEFLGGLFPGRAARRYAKAAANLQDVLGRLNDQAETRILLTRLAETAPARPAATRQALERGVGLVLGWQAQAIGAARAEAVEAWHGFIEQRPFWHLDDEAP